MGFTTLPSFTKTIDNDFVETWYEMRPDAADNILNATVVTAMLKDKGCFVPQRGGKVISRGVKYAVGPTPIAVAKGDSLPMGEVQTETNAFWNYQRTLAAQIQRSITDDTENAGKFQIKSYIKKRTTECMDALKQRIEGDFFRADVTDESGKNIQGFCSMIPNPLSSGRTTGTYGKIARPSSYTSDVPDGGNTIWSPRYGTLNLPIDTNLVSDMEHFFNVVNNQQEAPDMIWTNQTVYETYAGYGYDAIQMVGNQNILSLGFQTLKFKGADMTYVNAMANAATLFDGSTTGYNGLVSSLLFLNSRRMEVIYDPGLYFDMTEWKSIPNQMERVAHVLVRMTLISDQLRRHGLLYSST